MRLCEVSIILEVLAEDTVEQLTAKIGDKENMKLDEMRLIYVGKALGKGHTLVEYNIQRDCTVHLVLRLPGGRT